MNKEEFHNLLNKETTQVRAVIEDFLLKTSGTPSYIFFNKEKYNNLVQLAELVVDLELVNSITKPDYYILPPSDKRPPRLDITQWGYRTLLIKKGYKVNTVCVTQEFIDQGYFLGYDHVKNCVLWNNEKSKLVNPTEPLDIDLIKYIVVSISKGDNFFVEKVYAPSDVKKVHAPKGNGDLWSGKEKQFGISDAKHVQKTMYLKSVVRDLITTECRGLIPEAIIKAQYNASEDLIDYIRTGIERTSSPEEMKALLNQASSIKDYAITQSAITHEEFLIKNQAAVNKLCNKLNNISSIYELLDYYSDKKIYDWFCLENNLKFKNIIDAKTEKLLTTFLSDISKEDREVFYKKYQDFFELPLNRNLKAILKGDYNG